MLKRETAQRGVPLFPPNSERPYRWAARRGNQPASTAQGFILSPSELSIMSNSSSSPFSIISNTTLVGFVANPNGRGTLSLLWTCLFTIFTSTWSVLHLNAPAYGEKQWKVGLRKFRWMMVTVLFPEVVFAMAVRDLRQALQILDGFDKAVSTAHEASLKCTIWTARHSTGKVTVWKCRPPWHIQWLRWLVWLDIPFTKQALTATKRGQENAPEQEVTHRESHRLEGGDSNEPADAQELSEYHGLDIEATDGRGRVTRTNLRDADTTRATYDGLGPSDQVTTISGFEDRRSDMIVESLDWTLTHSYMVGMGGFVVPIPAISEESGASAAIEKYCVLTAESLLVDIFTERHDAIIAGFPLTEDDIRGLSKTNWFLKIVAIAQVLWVTLSVIGRASSHLPVTQLELATVSLAVSAIATYLLNWFKPQDLDGPFRSVTAETADWLLNNTAARVRLKSLLPLTWRDTGGDLDIIDRNEAHGLRRIKNDAFGRAYMEVVPTVLMIASSVVFGGLHCLAWNFEFPTGTEKSAWRISSLCYTITPTVTMVILFCSSLLGAIWFRSSKKGATNDPMWSSMRRLEDFPEMYWHNVLLYPNMQRTNKTEQQNLSFFASGAEFDKQCPDCASRLGELRARFEALTVHEASDLREVLVDVRMLLSLARNALSQSWDIRVFDDLKEQLAKVKGHAQTKPGVFALWKQWEVELRSKLTEHATSNAVPARLAKSSLDVVLEATKHWALTVGGGSEDWTWYGQVWLAFVVLTAISMIVAVASRLVIVVIIFTSLRQVPSGVYDGIAWPAWLPHFS
jgi:hypothetical protein